MIELKDYPQMIFAAVRGVGPYMETAGPSFGRIMAWAGPAGIMNPRTKVLGLSWDSPAEVPADRLRYDAAVTIDGPMALPEGINVGALPALTWATMTHAGPYARITETFGRLMDELARRRDLIAVGLCAMEDYLSGPGTPEADLRTVVGFPVVRVG